MKMPFTTTLFVLSLMIGSSVCAFRITSVSPASRNGTTEMDGTFSLTCIASASIRSCVWRHKDKACKLAYSATSGGLVKSRCKVYESKIFVVGDYKRHECAIQVQSASAYDSGMWKCEVREYVTRWNLFASPKTVTSSFHVKVMNKVRLHCSTVEISFTNNVALIRPPPPHFYNVLVWTPGFAQVRPGTPIKPPTPHTPSPHPKTYKKTTLYYFFKSEKSNKMFPKHYGMFSPV